MTEDKRFDEHAADYEATVQRAIGASGESVQFFADLKASLMAASLGTERPATILDFGCGVGNTTRAIAAVFADAQICGVDLSEESIAVARSIIPSDANDATRIRYSTMDETSLPFDDASFEAAFTACVFHHIEPSERVRWAKELRRVLAPGAPLFLFEHNPYNPLTRRVVAKVPFDEGVSLLTAGEATRVLRQAGFTASPPSFYFFFPAMLRSLRRFEPLLRSVPIGAQYFVVGR